MTPYGYLDRASGKLVEEPILDEEVLRWFYLGPPARRAHHAWLASRAATCNFYWDYYQGTMASPMNASCVNRETARRALFLLGFLLDAGAGAGGGVVRRGDSHARRGLTGGRRRASLARRSGAAEGRRGRAAVAARAGRTARARAGATALALAGGGNAIAVLAAAAGSAGEHEQATERFRVERVSIHDCFGLSKRSCSFT